MQRKSEKGISLIILVLTVIILAIITSITIEEIGGLMRKVRLETIGTDLLLVQAKAKVIAEKASFNDDEALLKGQQLNEITENDSIDSLKENGIISEEETHYDKYYVWNKQTIEELDLGITEMEDTDFFIVNYETEEVIYPIGYDHTDGNTYYKLTEITEL